MKHLTIFLSTIIMGMGTIPAANAFDSKCGTFNHEKVPVTIVNGQTKTIPVYWVAQGCAGIQPHCPNTVYVCSKTYLNPGQSASYCFPKGTTLKEVYGDGVETNCQFCSNTAVKPGDSVTITNQCQ